MQRSRFFDKIGPKYIWIGRLQQSIRSSSTVQIVLRPCRRRPLFLCLPGCQTGLHALGQGAGGGGFIELVFRSGQRSQHAHWNSTNIKTKCQTTVDGLAQELPNDTQSLVGSYFSRGWRNSWCSVWSGGPSWAARFPHSQTAPSSSPAEPTDAPPPEQQGSGG